MDIPFEHIRQSSQVYPNMYCITFPNLGLLGRGYEPKTHLCELKCAAYISGRCKIEGQYSCLTHA
jgi:hypothetical protein